MKNNILSGAHVLHAACTHPNNDTNRWENKQLGDVLEQIINAKTFCSQQHIRSNIILMVEEQNHKH